MATALPEGEKTLNERVASKPPMARQNHFPRRTILFVVSVLVLHLASAHVLDAVGLIESLLSPNGARLLWILPMAVFFYALRIAALFIAPGLVVASAILWLMDEVRARRRSNPNK